MRVISQNGLIDVPYGLTAFHICGGNVLMNMAGDNGKGTVMARYESDEKAVIAMEMLRESYAGNPVILQNIEVQPEETDAFKKSLRSNMTIKTIDECLVKCERITESVFQFPEDDEVKI